MTKKQKKHPLDDRTEFSAPDLIDATLRLMGEVCREDFYNKRLNPEVSGAFCILVDMATRIIDRGWVDWESMTRLNVYPSCVVNFAKALGPGAARWVVVGEELRKAAVTFKTRVQQKKDTKSKKRKRARAAAKR